MADSSTSADNVEGENENTMTLVDFLEEEQQLESDADAVLGPSDDKNCTYNLGYVPRQALYACITCTPQDNPNSKPAGICLACSYHCHEGHELVELYTKRLFRCDCGNSLFQGRKCNLVPDKSELNEKNTYNHNFKGVYCTCGRPYPDPEEEHSDDMHQCVICEDWYHTKHLNSPVPPDQLYAEMICGECSDRLPFLNYYLSHSVTNETQNVDVVGIEKTSENDTEKKEVNGEQQKEVICFLKSHEAQTRPLKSATFWPNEFRNLLCSCPECKILYNKLGVPWILDESDTVHAYEAQGKQGVGSLSRYEKGMNALSQAMSQLDRYQQVEVIQNYNDLKANLSEYLAKFVENKKVVRKEDVNEFFSQMNARKRQKLGTPPYMCH